jgi:hypothetical protein
MSEREYKRREFFLGIPHHREVFQALIYHCIFDQPSDVICGIQDYTRIFWSQIAFVALALQSLLKINYEKANK